MTIDHIFVTLDRLLADAISNIPRLLNTRPDIEVNRNHFFIAEQLYLVLMTDSRMT